MTDRPRSCIGADQAEDALLDREGRRPRAGARAATARATKEAAEGVQFTVGNGYEATISHRKLAPPGPHRLQCGPVHQPGEVLGVLVRWF